MNKEEILKVIDKGLESLLKEPNEIQRAFESGCRYTMNVFQSANKYWEKVEQENQELKDSIKLIMEMACEIEHNIDKYEEIGLENHFELAQKKAWELKDYLYNLLKGDKERNKNIGDMTNNELKDFIIELQEENSRYERRIYKAVEYIEEHTENIDRGNYYEDYVETYDVLEILKGDKE